MYRFVASLICIVSLAGCLEAGPARSIEIGGATALSQEDSRVIAARLDSYTARGWTRKAPAYVFGVSGTGATIQASAAPNDGDTKYLLSHQGKFQVTSEVGTPWFNQGHIADVAVGIDDQKHNVLRLVLTPEGASSYREVRRAGCLSLLPLECA